MINISIYQNEQDEYTGFRMEGHAGYAKRGQDIVCAAVSVLVINTINSIESMTEDRFEDTVREENGEIDFRVISSPISDSAELLLRSLVLGLQGIHSEYGNKYLKIRFIRKQEV